MAKPQPKTLLLMVIMIMGFMIVWQGFQIRDLRRQLGEAQADARTARREGYRQWIDLQVASQPAQTQPTEPQ